MVGLAGGQFDTDPIAHVEVISMWVDPAARREGLAVTLLDAITAWARERDAQHLQLWVTEGNSPAIALYQRFGFTPTGEQLRGIASDPARVEVAMRMPLSRSSTQ